MAEVNEYPWHVRRGNGNVVSRGRDMCVTMTVPALTRGAAGGRVHLAVAQRGGQLVQRGAGLCSAAISNTEWC